MLVEAGNVSRDEAFRAFNMGVGMVVIVPRADAGAIVTAIRASGTDAWVMGEVVAGGEGRVAL